MTTAQAAKAIGRDRRTLTRWVLEGKATPTFQAPGYRGVYLWSPKAVEALRSQLDGQSEGSR